MGKEKQVTLLCINDFHAEIFQTENTPGCARLVTAVEAYKNAHPDTIVLFGGDNYKGDPISETCGGEPVSKMMARLETAASAIGNHEFDFGVKAIKQWQQEGNYPFIAANLLDVRTGEIPEFVKPYIILQHGTLKIAVLGLAMQEKLSTIDRPAEMKWYEISDVVSSARYWIKHLKESHKPHAIVALTHLPLVTDKNTGDFRGNEIQALCQGIPELDGVFTAHLHQFIADEIRGIPVMQGGSSGRGWAVLNLRFSQEGRLTEKKAAYIDMQGACSQYEPDAVIDQMIGSCQKKAMQKLGKVVAKIGQTISHRDALTNEVAVTGTPFSTLGTAVMRQKTGCRIALFYAGRMGRGLEKGEVTLYQLHQLLLFNNGLVTMKLCGACIRKNIETGLRTLKGESASPIAVGGLKVVADMNAPYGKRLISVTFSGGELLQETELYEVVLDDYLAENPLGFDFSSGTDVIYTGISLRESMIEAICRSGTVDPKFQPDIELI